MAHYGTMTLESFRTVTIEQAEEVLAWLRGNCRSVVSDTEELAGWPLTLANCENQGAFIANVHCCLYTQAEDLGIEEYEPDEEWPAFVQEFYRAVWAEEDLTLSGSRGLIGPL